MIFDKEEVSKLQREMEICDNKGLQWDQVILSKLDTNETSCFSEFELFGNYVEKRNKILIPWKQKTLKRTDLNNLNELCKDYSKYLSVTFPSYLN